MVALPHIPSEKRSGRLISSGLYLLQWVNTRLDFNELLTTHSHLSQFCNTPAVAFITQE